MKLTDISLTHHDTVAKGEGRWTPKKIPLSAAPTDGSHASRVTNQQPGWKGISLMTLGNWMLAMLVATTLSLSFASPALGGDKVSVGQRWPTSEQISAEQANHVDWDLLVQKYVNRDGYVDYKGWKASTADQRALDTYLSSLSRVSPKLQASFKARLAFWINAYNALDYSGHPARVPNQ